VKESKQISTRVGEDVRHAHRENDVRYGRHAKQRFPDLPYLACQLTRGETWTDSQGGYPSGCRWTNGGQDLRA
jgi:hypothetical protein